jgi:CsbD-like
VVSASTSGYTILSPVTCNGGRHELKLTDDDLTAINGKREQLEGKLQERYGIAKDQARKEVDDWFREQTW